MRTAEIIQYIPRCEYYGYDIDKRAIEYAKKYSKKIVIFSVKNLKKEIKKLPQFDFVILFGILHHLNNVQAKKFYFYVKKNEKNSKLGLRINLIKNQNLSQSF